MSLKVFFVRHGQSEANLSDIFYDDKDAELTMLGKGQAVSVGQELKDLNVSFTAIYCSPYERAKATCAFALESAGIRDRKVIYDDRLIERRFDGMYGKGITHEEWVELFDYDSDLYAKLGVESLGDMEKRAKSFIEELKMKYVVGNILVFSHGLFELAVQTVVNGRPESGSMYYGLTMLKNCEMEVFQLK